MTATAIETPKPAGSARIRNPWHVVWRGLLLPFVYATVWYGKVAGEVRDYGQEAGDERLSRVLARRTVFGMLLGWVLVVPAVVVIVSTARRVQRAEGICFGTPQPITAVVATAVVAQTAGLACVLAGWAILVPVVLLANAVVVMRLLQPRLNGIWESPDTRPERAHGESSVGVPLFPEPVTFWWRGISEDSREGFMTWGGFGALVGFGWVVTVVGRLLTAEDRTGPFTGFVIALALTVLLIGTSLLIGSLVRQLIDRRPPHDAWFDGALVAAAAVSTVTAAAWLWAVRVAYHGVLMPLDQWPLVTWIPLAIGLVFTAVMVATGRKRAGIMWRQPVTLAIWGAFMVLLPGWQGHALYAATVYSPTDLPLTTQPRLLPKVAAVAFASDASLHDAHLVVYPSSDRLVWTAEKTKGMLRRGPSQGVTALALSSVTGASDEVSRGFDPAVSRVGPGSLQWRAYDRHYFTRVQDAVLVPGRDGEAVAVAPYLRYKGFPVRHPVWAGVYVYHQDGRMEDLTPQQALARPELAGSAGSIQSASPAPSRRLTATRPALRRI